jgi:hypothetical protein
MRVEPRPEAFQVGRARVRVPEREVAARRALAAAAREPLGVRLEERGRQEVVERRARDPHLVAEIARERERPVAVESPDGDPLGRERGVEFLGVEDAGRPPRAGLDRERRAARYVGGRGAEPASPPLEQVVGRAGQIAPAHHGSLGDADLVARRVRPLEPDRGPPAPLRQRDPRHQHDVTPKEVRGEARGGALVHLDAYPGGALRDDLERGGED